MIKRSALTTLVCTGLVAAGCSHRTHQMSYESSSTSAPQYGATTYNDQIYNQRSVDNNYRSSTESNPQSSTTYNQTTIETTPADRTLIQQVKAAIGNDTALTTIAPNIQVSAQGGTVTLSGNVQNEHQKRAVERAAKGTAGVVTVNNQLEVSSSANESSATQSGQSQTGGSQSSLYQNSNRQSQGSISGGTGASSASASVGASTDLKGAATNDTAQTGSFGKDSSSGATSGQASPSSGERLYSTKDDLATNSLNSAAGASGENSLGSTNSAQESSSLKSANESSSTPQGGTSSSFGSGTNSSLSSGAASQGESKNLSPTSSSESSRLYSTNQSDQAAGSSLSTDSSSGGSADTLALTVKGTTESDQKLADQVRQELRSNSAISGGMSRLRISLDNGKATLRGTVKSDQEKQDIEKSVQKVTGVTSVQNELRVSSNSGQTGTDENK